MVSVRCFQDLLVEPDQPTYAFTITPDSADIAIGDTVAPYSGTLTADGQAVDFRLGLAVTSGQDVIRLDSAGRIVPLRRGVARLTVRPLLSAFTSDTLRRQVTLRAIVPRLGVVASPSVDTLTSLGDTLVLRVAALTKAGDTIPGVEVVWRRVSGDTIATLLDSASGRIRAERNGEAEFVAAVDTATVRRRVVVRQTVASVAGPAMVRLSSLGQTAQLTAPVLDRRGNALAGITPSWASLDPGVATVVASGLLTAVSNGTARVVAAADTARDTVLVVVQQVVASVSVTPDAVSLAVSDTFRLAGTARDSLAQPVLAASVTWTSLAPAKLAVNAAGLLTALDTGVARVVAAVGAVSDTAVVTIALRADSLVVAPDTTRLASLGEQALLVARAYNRIAGLIVGKPVSWRSTDTAVVTVNDTGLVTARANGSARIIARADAVADTGVVLVSQVVHAVVVTPDTADVLLGDTLRLGMAVRDARGNAVAGAVPAWASSDSNVAAVDQVGLVRARGEGAVRVWAVASGKGDTTLVRVTRRALSVELSPPSVTMTALGDTVRFVATGRDASGAAIADKLFAWRSLDTVVVTVSGSGLLTARGNGSAGAVATADGVADTGSVTVAQAVDTIIVTPDSVAITMGDTVRFGAEARDRRGNVVAGVTVTWTSSDTTRAKVDASGLVRTTTFGRVLVTAAGGGKTTVAVLRITQPVARVEVTPNGVSLSGVGSTTTLVARAYDATGAEIEERTFTWASLNPNVATVNPVTGVVSAVAAGQATIAATAGGLIAYGLVTAAVSDPLPVARWIPMTSGTPQMLLGVWGASGSEVLAVSNMGTILRYNGTNWSAMVTGTGGGFWDVWGTSASDVYAVGGGGTILRYNGTSLSSMASGTGEDLRGIWGSSASDIYAVGNSGTILRYNGTGWSSMASGTGATLLGIWGTSASDIYAVGSGGTILRYDGTNWSSMASGTGAGLWGVWGTSASDIFAVGEGGTILRYNGSAWSIMTSGTGALLLGVWGTSGTEVFAVLSGNTILRYNGTSWTPMPLGIGQTMYGVWGTSGADVFAVGDFGTILRGHRGVASLRLSLDSATIFVGDSVRLTAPALDAMGRNLTTFPVTWTSSAPAVATLSTTGLVTAVGGGNALIVVASDGLADTATITVSSTRVASLVLTPASASALVRDSTQFTARTYDNLARELTNRVITWRSLDTTIAKVSATGWVRGVAPGSTSIIATSEGKADTSTITVNQRPVAAVVITPWAAGINTAGGTATFTAEARDAQGVVIPGKTVTWASANPAVVTIGSADGVAVGVASGQAAVLASVDGVRAYATVTVSVPSAQSITSWAAGASGTSNNLNAVRGASANAVYAVAGNPGGSGELRRFNGSSWSAVGTSGQALRGLAVAADSVVFVVGAGGQVGRFTSGAGLAASTPVVTNLEAVWSASPAEAFAVGANGTVVRYRDGSWTGTTAGVATTLNGVWGTSPRNVYAVGDGGVIRRFDGSAWTAVASPTTSDLYRIWGSDSTHIWAVGAGGTVVHFNGTSWSLTANGQTASALSGVWGTGPSDVYVVGEGGVALRYDGASWAAQSSGTAAFLYSVWGSSASEFWAVGAGGAMRVGQRASQAVRSVVVTPVGASLTGVGSTTTLAAEARTIGGSVITGKTITWTSLNPSVATADATSGAVTALASGQATIAATADGVSGYSLVTVVVPAALPVSLLQPVEAPGGNGLLSAWAASAGDVFAVGKSGLIVRSNGAAWSTMNSGVVYDLQAVWGTSPSDVYASGAGGLVHFDGEQWKAVATGFVWTQGNAVWGSSPKSVYVGTNGSGGLIHYDGSSWASTGLVLPGPVMSIWGSSSRDVYVAAGGGGHSEVRHFDGTSWSRAPLDVAADVAALWGAGPTTVFALTRQGHLARYDGTSWSVLGSRGPGANAIWGASPTDLYVASVYDTVFRYNGAAWSSVPGGFGGAQWHGVAGTSRGEVVVVGMVGASAGNVIARGIRIATVTVSPGASTLAALGATRQLTATASDESGAVIPGVSFTWSSSDPGIATVGVNGVVTAGANGTATITATAPGGANGTAGVTVGVPVASVALTPAGASLSGAGSTMTLTATPKDAAGTALTGRTVTWSSLNPYVATVSATGAVTAMASGQVTITATSGGATGYSLLTVAVPGDVPVGSWSAVTSGTGQRLYRVWGASGSNLYAVGTNGTILHYNGTSWTAMTSGTAEALHGVWGPSASEIYAVGNSGTILRYDGTSWSPMASGTGENLDRVWGISSSEMFAVGSSGTILRYDGTSWSQMASGTGQNLAWVWGTSGSDIYVVGGEGTILRYDGTSWSAMASGTGQHLYEVWGTSGSSIFAVGAGGTLLRYNGANWSAMSSGTSQPLVGVWGTSGSDVYAVGWGGTILRYDGTSWSSMTSGTGQELHGVWGTSGGEVYAVGAAGTILRGVRAATTASVVVTPAAASLSDVGSTTTLTATPKNAGGATLTDRTVTWSSLNPNVATVNASTGVVTAVTSGQVTIAATVDGVSGHALVTVSVAGTAPVNLWASESSGTFENIDNVWAIPGAAFAVGASKVLRNVGSGWVDITPASPPQLIAGWGQSATDLWVIGTGDQAYQYDGAAWRSVPKPRSDLWAIWGSSPSNIIAVGNDGSVPEARIVRYDGSAWTSMSIGVFPALRGVWGASASDAYAVGRAGTILRFDGSSWNSMASGTTQDLLDVWGLSASDVYAVGASGTILHYDGVSWSAVASGTTASLDGVWGTSGSDVYAVGDPGTVLRYDGSAWSPLPGGTSQARTSIGGTSTGSVFTVGAAGTMLRGYRGATVAVTPTSPTLAAAWATLQLAAIARDALGSAILGAVSYSWYSNRQEVVMVSASGLATAVVTGTATITATAPGGAAGSATVTVDLTAALQAARISAGAHHTCALTSAGAAYCWGYNSDGQLGIGTGGAGRTSPAAIPGGLTFRVISSGYLHTCGLTDGGTAYCWGRNGDGQLGDGTSSDRTSPTPVSGGLVFRAISTGYRHTCGLTADGAAYCWGRNEYGQLGDGSTSAHSSPVAVSGSLVFQAIGAGTDHTCALTMSGTAHCWGANADGQLGDGTGVSRTSPTRVSGDLVFQMLKTGSSHTCALTTSGAAYCWGANYALQLGDGTGGNRSSPVAVLGSQVFRAISAGWYHTCGLTSGGETHCWGGNGYGQLGDGAYESRGIPTAVTGGLTLQAISAGGTHTCGLAASGASYCWGFNSDGQLGDGVGVVRTSPVEVAGGHVFNAESVGDLHTCGLTAGGAARCWGFNGGGQLGDLSMSPRTEPAAVAGSLSFQKISAGGNHSCGLTAGGAAYCWGSNGSGQVGDGSSTSRTSPVAVSGSVVFQAISAGGSSVGGYFTCGLSSAGAAYCWGDNSFGQLGDGTSTGRVTPAAVSGGLTLQAIDAGVSNACGLTTGGAAYCWGDNSLGQLGDGTANGSGTPVPVSGGLVFQGIGVGDGHACGLTTGGVAYCWGGNRYGQLGDGTYADRTGPVAVAAGLLFRAISVGRYFACGLTSEGAAYCWGGNWYGQLGDGTTGSVRATPATVAGGLVFQDIAAGGTHACGFTAAGAAHCWGRSEWGQVGAGTGPRTSPSAVAGGVLFGAPPASPIAGVASPGLRFR